MHNDMPFFLKYHIKHNFILIDSENAGEMEKKIVPDSKVHFQSSLV